MPELREGLSIKYDPGGDCGYSLVRALADSPCPCPPAVARLSPCPPCTGTSLGNSTSPRTAMAAAGAESVLGGLAWRAGAAEGASCFCLGALQAERG